MLPNDAQTPTHFMYPRLQRANGELLLIKKQLDMYEKYNYLVESHFKTKHQVADYAEMLNKSPKTLSNLFKKYNEKSPLQIIQDRTILEARRLLRYLTRASKRLLMK
jgi:AraC-like DNA-binding protein